MQTEDINTKFTKVANFQEKQLEAWFTLMDPQCKYLLYGGALGGGKSRFLRWACIGLGMYYFLKYGMRRVPIGLFSEDYPTLKDRQLIKMKQEIPPYFGELIESRDEGYIFRGSPKYGEFIILLRNLDDPSKYQSTEFAAIAVEELTRNPAQTIIDLRSRLRYPGIDEVKFLAATNPGGIGHAYVKKKWVKPDFSDPDIEQKRFFFVPARFSDNKYLDKDYINQLLSLPEQQRKAYMDGSWDIFAGQFFSEWNDRLHTCPPFIPKKTSTIIGGMDWGRTAPFSFHLSTLQEKKIDGVSFNRSWTFFEAYGTNKTPQQWAKEIKEKLWKGYSLTVDNITWIRGDPAMFTKGQDSSLSIADQFLAEGIRIRPASNDRIGGWENLHKWLSIAPDGFPYWLIAENCINLIRTLPELVHDELRVEDVDTHGEDHAGDALRYMLKHVKWVDARVGGIGSSAPYRRPKYTANIDPETGEQISVNTDKFAITEQVRKVAGSV